MPSSYELWLTDDSGKRLCLLTGYSYFSYSRSVMGYGNFQMGMPLDILQKLVFPEFQVDRRIDIWRSPATGIPMRREGVFLLRNPKIYTRASDGVRMVMFYGWDPTHLLSRRHVIQAAGTPYTYKDGPIDDMMKEIVREQMLWDNARNVNGALDNDRAFPKTEFTVQPNVGLGPDYSLAFADRAVRDVLADLHSASLQMNALNFLDQKIYFDVVPRDLQDVAIYILDESGIPILDEDSAELLDESSYSGFGIGFQFQTFAGLRGTDRTLQLEFSVENNNLQEPYYTQITDQEANAVLVKGYGRGDSRLFAWVTDPDRIHASRWNRMERYEDGSQEPDQARLADIGYPILYANAPQEEFSAVLLNVEGGPDTPRSLYGLDWDLGDLVRASYAGKSWNVEIVIVYVGVNDQGQETITGRNQVAATAG